MKDLSLHILDIAENSVRAGAKLVEIAVIEDRQKDLLTLKISDNGRGMKPETICQATDPFFTTKSDKRHGLGLAFLAQATREADGKFHLDSIPGAGTRIRATFRYSHPDRKPLGDISATLETLVLANREVDFIYEHKRGAEVMQFDTRRLGTL